MRYTLSIKYKVHTEHAIESETENKLYDAKDQVVKDQEKAQSEKDSHSKNRVGKKTN